MIKYCYLKNENLEQEFKDQKEVEINEQLCPINDLRFCVWAQWDELSKNDDPIISIVNSYGETLAKCPKSIFDKYYII